MSSHVVNTIFDEVVKYLPIIKKDRERLQELFDKVIDPAVKLATTIRTSPTTYKFTPKIEKFFPFDNCIFTQQQLSDFKLVDIATGKTLKPDSPIQPNEQGQIGTEIMVLAPALYRCDPGSSALLLVKEVVLVQLFSPLGRRRAATGPSRSGPGKFSGVVM